MIRCSFCHKSQDEVVRIFSTPKTFSDKAYICNECIEICHNIILGENKQETKKTFRDITPEIIYEHVNQYVIAQEQAKKILAVAIYNHYKNISTKGQYETKLEKSNILMLGPSGVGKTHIVKTIASFLDMPFAIADATSLTESGYVGDDVESVIEHLIQSADGDIEKAKHGIIYIDEIDKKVTKSRSANTRDVSGSGVQQSLLKMVEGSVVNVKNNSGILPNDTIQFDTSDILFICGGAFIGIDKVIAKDMAGSSRIGFSSKPIKNIDQLLPHIKPQHLINYGMIPEFVGRFPVIATMHDLDKDDLIRILKEPKNNLISQFSLLFELDDVMIEFSEEFLSSIAQQCIEQKIGARGLRSVMEKSLLSLQYNLPGYSKRGINKIYIDEHGKAECFKVKDTDEAKIQHL